MKYTIKSETKELVSLRQRATKNGGQSLYLDYVVNGRRVREFLKMYLVPERTKIDVYQNQETLKIANAAKAKRIIALQNGQEDFVEKEKRSRGEKIRLVDYIAKRSEYYSQKGQSGIALNIMSLKGHCFAYKPNITLSQIDVPYLKGFVDFLGKRVAASSTTAYFSYLGITLNAAKREGLIRYNPVDLMESHEKPHMPESQRCYLTMDEVRRMGKASCPNEMVKAAFMFACFTGLRISDIKALRWDDIEKTDDGYQIQLKQQKTGRMVYIPLSDNALAWLPIKRGKTVFHDLPSIGNFRLYFDSWCASAEVTKHVTFHVSRHTFATLALTYGADLYTVSKLLGHKDIATTQVYARVVDENKRKAVNLIPSV